MEPGILLALAALFGLIIGSFCNVVIHRLPRMIELEWRNELRQFEREQQGLEPLPASELEQLSLSLPRSHCPHCRTPLRIRDLVPVLSWLALRGRCHHCQATISLRYPLVELISAGLAVFVCLHFGLTMAALASYGLLQTLLVATLVDWDSQWLPDVITLPLMWAGLLLASLDLSPIDLSLHEALWGVMAGYLVLWLISEIFLRATGKDGLGGGDTKLLAALGAWLGGLLLPSVLLLASLLGLLIALWMRWRRGIQGAFPFGPALSVAGALFFWQQVMVLP